MKKIKIIFLITSFTTGGAEKAMLCILKHLDRQLFSPHLVLLKYEGELLNKIPTDIVTFGLGMKGCKIGKELPFLIFRFRKIVKNVRPDLVISFLWDSDIVNLTTRIISKQYKMIFGVHIAINLSFESIFGGGIRRKCATYFTKFFYPMADHFISVSDGIKKELSSMGLSSQNITIIHNPIDIKLINGLKAEPVDIKTPYILFVGRIDKQKNIPLLINAFNSIKNDYDINLVILGEGKEENNLKKLTKILGIENRVMFKNFTANPYKYMYKARVLILSSNFEGLPTVLLEAMACGTPVISTDCNFGPREIITNGKNGFLVPLRDKNAIETAIRIIFNDAALRERLIIEGLKRVKDFEAKTIVKEYEQLIYSVYIERRQKRIWNENLICN